MSWWPHKPTSITAGVNVPPQMCFPNRSRHRKEKSHSWTTHSKFSFSLTLAATFSFPIKRLTTLLPVTTEFRLAVWRGAVVLFFSCRHLHTHTHSPRPVAQRGGDESKRVQLRTPPYAGERNRLSVCSSFCESWTDMCLEVVSFNQMSCVSCIFNFCCVEITLRSYCEFSRKLMFLFLFLQFRLLFCSEWLWKRGRSSPWAAPSLMRTELTLSGRIPKDTLCSSIAIEVNLAALVLQSQQYMY